MKGRRKKEKKRDAKSAKRAERVLAINAPHKKSSPSLMGSTLLGDTRRVFLRGKKEGEKEHAEG